MGFVISNEKQMFDLDRSAMQREISRFVSQLDEQTVALVYYSGHGLENLNENYLVPRSANLESIDDLKGQLVSLNELLREMGNRRAKARIVILDACRNFPDLEGGTKTIGETGGFGEVKIGAGLRLVYAAEPGQRALPARAGERNSVFTRALLSAVREPALGTFDQVIHRAGEITQELTRRSDGSSFQQPWIAGSAGMTFRLRTRVGQEAPSASANSMSTPHSLQVAPPSPVYRPLPWNEIYRSLGSEGLPKSALLGRGFLSFDFHLSTKQLAYLSSEPGDSFLVLAIPNKSPLTVKTKVHQLSSRLEFSPSGEYLLINHTLGHTVYRTLDGAVSGNAGGPAMWDPNESHSFLERKPSSDKAPIYIFYSTEVSTAKRSEVYRFRLAKSYSSFGFWLMGINRDRTAWINLPSDELALVDKNSIRTTFKYDMGSFGVLPQHIFIRNSGKWALHDATTGQLVKDTTHLEGLKGESLFVSPNGTIVGGLELTKDGPFRVRLWSLSSGRELVTVDMKRDLRESSTSQNIGNEFNPRFTPDGRHLVFVHASRGLSLLELQTFQVTELPPLPWAGNSFRLVGDHILTKGGLFAPGAN
jgi:Caspase domain